MTHSHGGATTSGWTLFDGAVVVLLGVCILGYGLALWRTRSRSPWPAYRTALWVLGVLCAGAALTGPLARAAHGDFAMHMVGHLLLGMLAPLFMVLAAPISLILRVLPVPMARSLSRVLRSPVARGVAHPVTAAVLNGGGLWLLYRTGLFGAMHESVLMHALVHAHIFIAGCLFTAAIIGVDPNPHRASVRTRSVVLIGFIAAHQILAKHLYAHPPVGVDRADGEVGAQVMFYGGDVVDISVIILLLAGWYRASRPAPSVTPQPA